jgi:xylulokinase
VVLLGIDIGTSGTKGVLVTPAGEVLASEQIGHEISLPRPGWAEVDAERVWWSDVREICRRLVARVPGEVVGVGVSGVGPSLVLCDADLVPQRPAILYGIDTRASAEIADLTKRYGAEEILASSGKFLTSQALGPKLEWVRRHEPDVWRRSVGWYGCHSYLAAKLTGEYVLDHHTASQCDPLYRVPDFAWHADWAADLSAPMRLPRLAWPSEVIGTVTDASAAETGLRAGTPVVAGTVDALAEAFSVGVRSPGDVMIMYGSTIFVVQIMGEYRAVPNLWTTAGVDPRTHALTGGTATAGSFISWLQRLMGDPDLDGLGAKAAAVAPGCEGLLVLPYLAGERTPLFDPNARGVVAGLTLRHTRAHLLRASYEGIGFGVRQMLDLFSDPAVPTNRTVAVGGGLRSPVWTSVISDITNRTQQIPKEGIGACYGSAQLAAIGIGLVPAGTDWTVIDREVPPNSANRTRYDELYRVWLQLYPGTRDPIHSLAGWS